MLNFLAVETFPNDEALLIWNETRVEAGSEGSQGLSGTPR